MKLKLILLIALFLFPVHTQAQSEQLQREIRIAEGILQELFQENLRGESPFIAFTSNRVTSDYIPGYGVHFILGNSLWTNNLNPARINEIRIVQSTENRRASVAVRNDDQDANSEAEEVTVEELEKRMKEYFTQYASLLRNLPENEHIRLSTGLRSPATNIFISLDQGSRNIDFPMITKWVSKNDLLEFENGRISEDRFIQRIQYADLSEVTEKRDFNIFKSILDTSVQEADFKQLRIRSASSYTYLPGFGVQFNLNANTRGSGPLGLVFSPGSPSDIDMDVRFDMQGNITSGDREAFRREMDSIRNESRKALDSLKVAVEDVAISLRDAAVSFRSAYTMDREPIDPELVRNDKKLLYDEVTWAIRDYGSTLSSLPDDEFIIVSVNWSARDSTLPERTYIRLKKSELSTDNLPDIQEIARR